MLKFSKFSFAILILLSKLNHCMSQDSSLVVYYPNNQEAIRINNKDNILRGSLISYYDNSKKEVSMVFNNAVINDTLISYYRSGQMQFSGGFENGKPKGEWIWLYKNGNIFRKCNFINDTINGLWEEYWINGKKKEEGIGNGWQGCVQMTTDQDNSYSGKLLDSIKYLNHQYESFNEANFCGLEEDNYITNFTCKWTLEILLS